MKHTSQSPKIIYLTVLLLLSPALSFVSSFTAHADKPSSLELTPAEQAWLDRNAGKLVLFFNTEFPPIEFISETGAFTGMGADVIALVEKQLGVTFIKRPCKDWSLHLAALADGTCAIAPTIVATPAREQYAFFTTPYATAPVVIITRRGASHGMALDDLEGKTVAVVSGFATESYAKARSRGRFEIIPVSNVPEGLHSVSLGHTDALLENLAVAAYYIDQEGISNLRVAGATDYAFAWSIGISRKYPVLFSAVQKALAKIPESDLAAVHRKWISLEVATWLSAETWRLIQVITGFVVLLLAGLAGISYVLKRRLNEKVANLKSAQQKLVDQADRLKLATEALNAGVWDYYPVSGEHFLSSQWWAMLGYPPATRAFSLAELMEFVHSDDIPVVENAFREYIAAGGQGQIEVEFRRHKADGEWFWVLSKGQAVEWDETGTISRIIGLDINIQNIKEDQERLAQSEALFRALFKMAPIPMATISLDGRVLDVNDRLIEVLGYTIDQVPTLEHWWRLAHPDPAYRSRMIADWNAVFDRISTSTAPYNLGEIKVTCKNGRELTTIIHTNRIRDFIVASFFDITERKTAEQERETLQEQLLQAQKLEAVGVLAGGVAHDFNNMLGAIIGFAELTLEAMDDDSPYRQYLDNIREAARHSIDLTGQLLAFARKQTIAPTALDLNQAIESMLKILQRLLGENIELSWRPMSGPCTVKLDPSQLNQILTNLCVNARDAIADVGKVTIETAAAVVDADYCAAHAGFIPGRYMTLAVSDDGAGMDRKIMEHIFDPFFTTKQKGKGTGLGLATVYGIVRQNEGFINAYSEPGKGTIFRVYLPRHVAEGEIVQPGELQEMPVSRGETILVVEDDDMFRDMGTTMLERLGYHVMAAATPGEAMALVELHGSNIDLLISDVIMPEMNGRDLAARIQAASPAIRLLFMSGYTANVIAHRGVLEDGINFLQKPFLLPELAAKVREVLDQAV